MATNHIELKPWFQENKPITNQSSHVPRNGVPTLYRIWDKNKRLLYIGKSIRANERSGDHRQFARWRDEIAAFTYQTGFTKQQLARVEAERIRFELPKYKNDLDEPVPEQP